MKISVLVPTLGHREKELSRLLDSVVRQKYNDVEVIIISQDNREKVDSICRRYIDQLNIKHITSERGLSKSRNCGMKIIKNGIVLLSDDDCWYPDGSFKKIKQEFQKRDVDIILTQIYDPYNKCFYKNYPNRGGSIRKPFEVLSKSSIEIAFKMPIDLFFDEEFGLGAKYVSGEENDFLVRALKNGKKIYYEPIVTVFHLKKNNKSNEKQLIAKGAFYKKNFSFLISFAVCMRDFFKKKQNNFKFFYRGYKSYQKK